MGVESRMYVYHSSKTMYHLLLFVSFMLAVLTIPYTSPYISQYVTNQILLQLLGYVVAYILATYIYPEVLFMIYKSSTSE